MERVIAGMSAFVAWTVLGVALSFGAAGPIRMRIIIVKGSVWDSPDGMKRIQEQIGETQRIWIGNGGIDLNVDPPVDFVKVAGDPNSLTKQDIVDYATTHKADARTIAVVFTNRSWSSSRAWTEESLVKNDTPVIVIGKQVSDDAGTKRDLAHETGHVLLRTAEHSTGRSDLMNLGKNVGDGLRPSQISVVRRYPDLAEKPGWGLWFKDRAWLLYGGGMPKPDSNSWSECETSASKICGDWNWDSKKGQFNAKWRNGALATLTLVSQDKTEVVITRFDSGGTTAGLIARYVGQRSGEKVQGSVTWVYSGRRWSGTWEAHW